MFTTADRFRVFFDCRPQSSEQALRLAGGQVAEQHVTGVQRQQHLYLGIQRENLKAICGREWVA